MNKKELEKYAEARRKAAAEAARERVEIHSLVDVLQNFALGRGQTYTQTFKNGKTKTINNIPKLTPGRIKAIDILLSKSMPDLSAVKHDVQVDNMTFVISTDLPDKKK